MVPAEIPSGYGPIGGEFYDDSDWNETLDVAAYWTGKTVERIYEDRTGLTKIVFTDGSWADLYHRKCHNAGPGTLVVAGGAGEVVAR